MLLHIDWVTSLTSTVRKYTQVPVEDYIDSITTPGVPLDFVGLTVLCCIFHIHVGVFFSNGCWCTSRAKDLSKARFGIVFHGNLTFTETVRKGWSEKYLFWIKTRQAQGKMPSHDRTRVPGLLKRELPADHEEQSDIVPSHAVDLKQELKPEVKRLVAGTVQKLVTGAKRTLLQKEIKLKRQNSASISAIPTLPTLPAQSSAVSTTTTVPAKKSRQIGGERLKGPQVCPVCGQLEKSQSTLNIHIAAQHPAYQFPCTVCAKSYSSYNSWYKHQIEHTPRTFFCVECSEGFHFEAELQRHMNVHCDLKPFGCDLCEKRFTQNKSLTRHRKVHDSNPVTCSMCDKSCQTPEQLYTHYRGAHGKGYTAPCGAQYQWPAARAQHQGDCTPCKHQLELRKLKKKFPMPFKKEDGARTVKHEKQERNE